jgi:hypothetical protein
MKKVWKWIIGIVVVLVVVAALVGGAFLMRNHYANLFGIARVNRSMQVPGHNWGNRNFPERSPYMQPFGNDGWGGHGMFMRRPGMMPFGGFIGVLFSLGILALVVMGIIWLVERLRSPKVTAAPVASATAVEPVAPAAPVVEVHPCPKCGEPVQEDWKHCPHCGKRL